MSKRSLLSAVDCAGAGDDKPGWGGQLDSDHNCAVMKHFSEDLSEAKQDSLTDDTSPLGEDPLGAQTSHPPAGAASSRQATTSTATNAADRCESFGKKSTDSSGTLLLPRREAADRLVDKIWGICKGASEAHAEVVSAPTPLASTDRIHEVIESTNSRIGAMTNVEELRTVALGLNSIIGDAMKKLISILPASRTPVAFATRTCFSTPDTDNDAAAFDLSLDDSEDGDVPAAVEPKVTSTLRVEKDDAGFKLINNYVIVRELGRGVYGKVKLACDGKSGEEVAIKIIKHERVKPNRLRNLTQGRIDATTRVAAARGAAAQACRTMDREVALMSRLNHRNVLKLREVINDPDAAKIYLVMDYAARGPLLKVRPDGTCPPMDLEVAKGYMKQLVEGLCYLHKHNVVHRDIKPDNLLIGENGVVYFADFGVSSNFTTSDQAFDDVAGTVLFHAPEICLGGQFTPLPADVWALGMVFYMMIYGQHPFRGKSHDELRSAIMSQEIEFPMIEQRHGPPVSISSEYLFSMSHSTIGGGDGLNDSACPSAPDSPRGPVGGTDINSHSISGFNSMGDSVDVASLEGLLRGMLQRDAARRLSAKKCRQHPFFCPGSPSPSPSKSRVERALRDSVSHMRANGPGNRSRVLHSGERGRNDSPAVGTSCVKSIEFFPLVPPPTAQREDHFLRSGTEQPAEDDSLQFARQLNVPEHTAMRSATLPPADPPFS